MRYLVAFFLFVLCQINMSFAEDLTELSREAYIYGYPLVMMDATEKVAAANTPINQFFNFRQFPTPAFKEVVSPNADTLYSSAWLDLTKEPIVLSIPEIKDRYYVFPLLDTWTNVFYSISPRTTQNSQGAYAIVGPQWKGTLPTAVKQINSPTNTVWIIGRIKTNGEKDYAAVNQLQDQLSLTPLSAWGKIQKPVSAQNTHLNLAISPVAQVNQMDAKAFYTRFAQLLKNNPPLPDDKEILLKLAKIHIVPGQDYDPKLFSEQQMHELNEGINQAKASLKAEWKHPTFAKKINGWSILQGHIGTYGKNYLLRAAVALAGLGANLPEDAIYPKTDVDSEGVPLNGSNQYLIHFDKGQLPPTHAFWSITMYNDQQFFVENPLHRYNISSSDPLHYNQDGSLDIYIQHTPPKVESNWLPAPEGGFNLIMRIYQPKEAALNGTWSPPPVKQVEPPFVNPIILPSISE